MDRISNFSKKTWRDFIAENAELRAEITQLQCEVRDLLGVKKAFLQLCRQHYEERVILNDTIDKLTAERDAAVADLKEISYCCNCIQCLEKDGDDIWCGAFADWFLWCDTCNEWQWRCLSLEKTSDKQELERRREHD